MKAERIGSTTHWTILRFLDRIPRRIETRKKGVRIEAGHVHVHWKSFAREYPQTGRLMRLFRRLHGDWR